MFCVTKKHIFSRELLDTWLWDICDTGGTFRDVYTAWSPKACASSSSVHRIGSSEIVSSQLSNESFTLFIKTLKFPNHKNLIELFFCFVCEKRDDHGNRYIDGVVMDVTALGILGTLPTFERHTEVVSSVPLIPEKQFIMREPKLCSVVDAILVSAKSAGENSDFFRFP